MKEKKVINKNKSRNNSKSRSRGRSKNRRKSRKRVNSNSRSKSRSKSRNKRKIRSKSKKNLKNISFKYNPVNIVYKIENGNMVEKLYEVKISKHIPAIIKMLINNIPYKFNNYYILCPFYSNNEDFQIGVTETLKYKENFEDAVIRGGNEELGIEIKYWHQNNVKRVNNYKSWYGTSVNKNYTLNPNVIFNKNLDNVKKKIALIVFDKLENILEIYKNYKKGDIKTDNISAIGLISVYDAKKIINNFSYYNK